MSGAPPPLPPAELRQQAIAAELRRQHPERYPNTEAGGHRAMEDAATAMDAESRLAAAVLAEREACARLATGWQARAAGDDYMTSGHGRYWDPETMYAQGRMDAGADIRARPAPDVVRIPCAMSGERETLVVKPIGRCGVSFSYGEDASVIVDGDNLVRIRSIIDTQIAGTAAAQQNIDMKGAEHG